jgi:PAS domain S-box-containing protein
MSLLTQQIIENSNDAIIVLDRDFNIILFNKAFSDLIGFTAAKQVKVDTKITDYINSSLIQLNLNANIQRCFEDGRIESLVDISFVSALDSKDYLLTLKVVYQKINNVDIDYCAMNVTVISKIEKNEYTETRYSQLFEAFSSFTLDEILILNPVLENEKIKDFVVNYYNKASRNGLLKSLKNDIINFKINEHIENYFSSKLFEDMIAVYTKKDAIKSEYVIEQQGSISYYKTQIIPFGNEIICILLNITDTRLKEQLLEQSKREYQNIVQSQSDLIVVCKNNELVFCNNAFLDYFNVVFEEVEGKKYYSLLTEEELNRYKNYKDSFSVQKDEDEFLMNVVVNGSTRWIEWKDNAHFNVEGQLIEFQSIGRDITDKILSEKALEESEEKWKFALEGMGDGLWEWYPSSYLVNYSQIGLDLLNLTNLDLDYRIWEDRLHPDDKYETLNAIEKLLNQEVDFYQTEYRFLIDKDKQRYRWISERAKVIEFDSDNKPYKVLGTMRAIDDKKALEESLIQYKEFLDNIINSSPNPLYITNEEGTYLLINDTFCDTFGLEKDELLGNSEYLHYNSISYDELFEYNHKALEEHWLVEINYTKELRGQRKDYKIIKKGIKTETDNKFIITSFYDITKEIENENILKSTISTKDRFFSVISHDLKNPISGFFNALDVLDKDIKNFSLKDINEFIFELKNNAKNLYELLDNLLEWAKLQQNVTRLEPTDISLRNLVDLLFNVASIMAKNKHIELVNSVKAEVVGYADMNAINTVIRNLLFNAIKFTPENGTINIVNSEKEGMIVISIVDNGVGIPEHNLKKLFRLDEKLTTEGTNNEKGTGLGLILCKELVNKCGGEIWVESELGKGTKFSFTIPKSEAQYE